MGDRRLLLISDTHGTVAPRIAELAIGCDYVVHAGDIGADSVLDALVPRREVVAVRGNNDTPGCDPALARNVLALADEARLDLPGGALVVTHGHRFNPVARRHQRLRSRYDDARLIVYGHSHRMEVDTTNIPWVANPGAAGRSRTHGGPSCLLLTIAGSNWALAPIRFTPL